MEREAHPHAGRWRGGSRRRGTRATSCQRERVHSVKRQHSFFASPQTRRHKGNQERKGGDPQRKQESKTRGSDRTTREGGGVPAFPPLPPSAHRYDEHTRYEGCETLILAPRPHLTDGILSLFSSHPQSMLFLSFPAMVPAITSVFCSGFRVLVSYGGHVLRDFPLTTCCSPM